MMSVEDVCEILSAELLGAVPDDEEVIDTTNRGEPIVLDRDASVSRRSTTRSRAGSTARSFRSRNLDTPEFFGRLLTLWKAG